MILKLLSQYTSRQTPFTTQLNFCWKISLNFLFEYFFHESVVKKIKRKMPRGNKKYNHWIYFDRKVNERKIEPWLEFWTGNLTGFVNRFVDRESTVVNRDLYQIFLVVGNKSWKPHFASGLVKIQKNLSLVKHTNCVYCWRNEVQSGRPIL